MAKYSQKKQTTRNKTKNKNKNKKSLRHKYKGGQLFGFGSSGFVYGNPRPLCIDEMYENTLEHEVGKIQTIDSALKEIEILNLLMRYNVPITIFSKYAILPIKICKLNKSILSSMNAPYTIDWYKNRKGQEYKNTTLDQKYSHQVVYKKGGKNVQSIINDFDKVLEFNNSLTPNDIDNYEKSAVKLII